AAAAPATDAPPRPKWPRRSEPAMTPWSRGLRDVGIVDALHIRQREARLRPVVPTAARERTARGRNHRQAIAAQVAQAVPLEEELTPAVFDQLILHLLRRLPARRRGRQTGARGSRGVD